MEVTIEHLKITISIWHILNSYQLTLLSLSADPFWSDIFIKLSDGSVS